MRPNEGHFVFSELTNRVHDLYSGGIMDALSYA